MNSLIISKCLEKYDAAKGFFRQLIDESHIGELREFYYTLIQGTIDKKRELSLVEELELILIILKKNTWDDSASSTAFKQLLADIAGNDSLQTFQLLKSNQLLTIQNIQLIKQYQPYHYLVARLMVIFSDTKNLIKFDLADVIETINWINIEQCLTEINTLATAGLLSKQSFELISTTELPTTINDLLLLLEEKMLATPENIKKIAQIKNHKSLAKILSLLKSANLSLINQSNFDIICANDNSNYRFGEIIEALSLVNTINQLNLDKLFKAITTIKTNPWISDVLKKFHQFKWTLNVSNFDNILVYACSCEKINAAFDSFSQLLTSVSLQKEWMEWIINVLIASSLSHNFLIRGIKTLSDSNLLTKENLKKIFMKPGYADKLALAISTLEKNTYVSLEIKKRVLTIPEFADKLAEAMQLLDNVTLTQVEIDAIFTNHKHAIILANDLKILIDTRLYKPEFSDIVTKNPNDAGAITAIFECLKKCNLLTTENVQLLHDKRLITIIFSKLLYKLFNKNIIGDNISFNKIIALISQEKVIYFKALYSGCTCLESAKKLNNTTFEELLNNSLYALQKAEKLGGLDTNPATSISDRGAIERRRIQELANELSRPDSYQHSFFKPKLAMDKASFLAHILSIPNDYLEKDVREAIAIDAYDSLEKDTEETIVSKAYDGF